MKSIFLIITLLVVSLSSFTTYKSFVASISLIQTTDSIPAMNKQIIEFVGLRPKLYSFKTDDLKEKKTCKGVKRNVVKNDINVDDYKNTLYTHENKEIVQNGIRSYNHEIY